MRINELLIEQQQLDELSLKGLGTGLGKAVGAVAGGAVQGAKNIWSGAKQGYQAGQQAVAPDGADTSSAASGGWGTPTTTIPAPTTNTTAPAPANTGGPGEVASNDLLARAKQGTTQDPAAQTTPEVEPAATTPPVTPPPAPTTEPAVDPKVDQQSKIGVGQINKIIPTLRTRDLNSVKKNVDATLAKKAKPAPAAAPAAPTAPTQAELDADHERMASGTNESRVVIFRSKFLGMDI
jgi:hypothetical protein